MTTMLSTSTSNMLSSTSANTDYADRLAQLLTSTTNNHAQSPTSPAHRTLNARHSIASNHSTDDHHTQATHPATTATIHALQHAEHTKQQMEDELQQYITHLQSLTLLPMDFGTEEELVAADSSQPHAESQRNSYQRASLCANTSNDNAPPAAVDAAQMDTVQDEVAELDALLDAVTQRAQNTAHQPSPDTETFLTATDLEHIPYDDNAALITTSTAVTDVELSNEYNLPTDHQQQLEAIEQQIQQLKSFKHSRHASSTVHFTSQQIHTLLMNPHLQSIQQTVDAASSLAVTDRRHVFHDIALQDMIPPVNTADSDWVEERRNMRLHRKTKTNGSTSDNGDKRSSVMRRASVESGSSAKPVVAGQSDADDMLSTDDSDDELTLSMSDESEPRTKALSTAVDYELEQAVRRIHKWSQHQGSADAFDADKPQDSESKTESPPAPVISSTGAVPTIPSSILADVTDSIANARRPGAAASSSSNTKQRENLSVEDRFKRLEAHTSEVKRQFAKEPAVERRRHPPGAPSMVSPSNNTSNRTLANSSSFLPDIHAKPPSASGSKGDTSQPKQQRNKNRSKLSAES